MPVFENIDLECMEVRERQSAWRWCGRGRVHGGAGEEECIEVRERKSAWRCGRGRVYRKKKKAVL